MSFPTSHFICFRNLGNVCSSDTVSSCIRAVKEMGVVEHGIFSFSVL